MSPCQPHWGLRVKYAHVRALEYNVDLQLSCLLLLQPTVMERYRCSFPGLSKAPKGEFPSWNPVTSSIILFFSKALRKEPLRFWFAWHNSVTRAVITELLICQGMRRLCLWLGLCVVYRKAELSQGYSSFSNATKPGGFPSWLHPDSKKDQRYEQ